MQHIGFYTTRISQAFICQRERWPLWLPVLLGTGIGGYFALPFEPALWIAWASVALLAGAAWPLRKRPGVSLALIVGLMTSLGFAVAGLRTWWVAAPVIVGETGPVTVTGQVERLETLDKGLRVTLGRLHLQRHSSALGPDATPKTVRVKLSGTQPAFQPGDWLELRASLRAPPPPAMPGAFDFQRQSYFRGLGGVGFAYGKAKVVGLASVDGIESLRFAVQRLRATIAARVRAGLSGQKGAVAAALMTGERGAIPKTVLENMRASGLAHLLAISGLHVGLVAGLVFFALRALLALAPPLALHHPVKKWAAGAAIGAAFGYALMAGATVPTQRAFLMISLVLLAVLFDRKAISMRLVAWAAMAILLIAPESLLGASFQMSFAAVVALVAAYEVLQRRGLFVRHADTFLGQIGRYVLGVTLTTAIAGSATAIFAAYHFNRFADFGLVANVIAVPITALWIMPWALVTYLALPLGLESWALAPMGWGIDVVLATAHTVASWPGAVTSVAAFPAWGLVLLALGGLWGALWQGRLRLWGGALAALGLLSFWAYSAPDVLVHQDGKLAAVRTQDGQNEHRYVFSTLTSAKFERDIWLRRAGLNAPAARWTDPNGDALRCDALGCVYRALGKTVAFARTPEAAAEDCWNADVVIITAPDTDCVGPGVTITARGLQSKGAHAIWLDGSEGDDGGQDRDRKGAENAPQKAAVRIETVAGRRGDRPWVIIPKTSSRR